MVFVLGFVVFALGHVVLMLGFDVFVLGFIILVLGFAWGCGEAWIWRLVKPVLFLIKRLAGNALLLDWLGMVQISAENDSQFVDAV